LLLGTKSFDIKRLRLGDALDGLYLLFNSCIFFSILTKRVPQIAYYLVRVLDTIGITQQREQNILNGSLYIFNWFSAIASAFLTAYLKRRTQFFISVCGMLTVFSVQTLCAGLFNEQHNIAAGKGVVPMLFLFYLFYNLAFNALLFSYPTEVLPYPIRARGMSVLLLCGRSAQVINTLVTPVGLKAIGWKYYLVYVGFLVVEVVCVYLFIVETKGPSLEAIAERFDGKNPVIQTVEAGEDEKEKVIRVIEIKEVSI